MQAPRAGTLVPRSFVFWLSLYVHYEIRNFILQSKRLELVRVWYGRVRYSEPLHIGEVELLSVYVDEPARAQVSSMEGDSLRLLYGGAAKNERCFRNSLNSVEPYALLEGGSSKVHSSVEGSSSKVRSLIKGGSSKVRPLLAEGGSNKAHPPAEDDSREVRPLA